MNTIFYPRQTFSVQTGHDASGLADTGIERARDMAAKKTIQASKAKGKAAERRVYFKQADFPMLSLQQAPRIASALVDNFGGRKGSPPDIALAMNVSPTSSAWHPLAGSAVAYGITEGGVNANAISLTPLGRRLVAPETEEDDLVARREAILRPRIIGERSFRTTLLRGLS